MSRDEKRLWRKLKRDVKRAGNKRRRRYLKHELAEHPEAAPFTEFDFGHYQSAPLNGMDQDSTRKAPQGGATELTVAPHGNDLAQSKMASGQSSTAGRIAYPTCLNRLHRRDRTPRGRCVPLPPLKAARCSAAPPGR
jgi:hypothetical protein